MRTILSILCLFSLIACSLDHTATDYHATVDACGDPSPTDDAAPLADAPLEPINIVVQIGQSNNLGAAGGQQVLDNQVYPAMPFYAHLGIDPYETRYDWAPLGIRTTLSGQIHVGPEIDLARRLEEIEPGRWAIFKFAISSTSIQHWLPTTNYPAGYPNAYTQLVTELAAARAAIGGRIRFVSLSLGETDASQQSSANLYQSRVQALHDAIANELDLAGVPWIVWRLHASNQAPGGPTVRAAQDALGALPGYTTLVLDSYPLHADRIHYTLASQLALGSEIADAFFD